MDPRAGRRVRGGTGKFLAEVRDSLIAYARHAFWLAERQPDGETRGAHLEAAARRSAAAARELEAPDLSDVAAPVWAWFTEISARRGSGGFGPSPLGYDAIEAWERRAGVRLAPHEIEWIFELDRLFLAASVPAPGPGPAGRRA